MDKTFEISEDGKVLIRVNDCCMTHIIIPDGITDIKRSDFVFRECTLLQSIVIPKSLKRISGLTFRHCKSLHTITVDENNESFADVDGIMYTKDLTEIVLVPQGKNIVKFKIPNFVKKIRRGAFYNCKCLQSVEIPDSVVNIEEKAFEKCVSLESINIPQCVNIINDSVFAHCTSLKFINLHNHIIKIGYSAFENTAIETFFIPKSVNEVDISAFAACKKLKTIEVDEQNLMLCSIDGVLYNKSEDEILVFPCNKDILSYTFPDTVRTIGYEAFSYCTSLNSITIPGSIKEIGYSSFAKLNHLTSVTIGDGVEIIGEKAFSDCCSLKSIYISKSVRDIKISAFDGCNSLQEINVDEDNNVYSSKDGILFSKDSTKVVLFPIGKQINQYEIPQTVHIIYDYAFCRCNKLTSIIIPNSVTNINKGAFQGCSGLTTIEIPNNVTSIGSYAFYGCESLNRVEIPDSVVYIGEWAFADCKSLIQVNLPKDLERIKKYSFSNCISLSHIVVPKKVADIGERAFEGTKWFDKLIKSCNGLLLINGVLLNSDYLQDTESICLPYGIKVIGDEVFKNFKFLKYIDIPNSVIKIGESSFCGCTCLKSIDIPYSVKVIGDAAFEGCVSLQDVDIPDSVETIGDNAFQGCKSLIHISLPNKLKFINAGVFANCISLETVNIPDSVTIIRGAYFYGAFDSCRSLKTIRLPEKLEIIGNKAFHNAGLEEIRIPNSVEWIGEHALCNCPLHHIDVGDQNRVYKSINGVLYSYQSMEYKKESLHHTITIVPQKNIIKSIIKYPPHIVEDTFYLDKDVIYLMSCTFKNSGNLRNIILHDNVESLGEQQTFTSCTSLTSIVIPPKVQDIPKMAFYNCSNLEEVFLPKTNTLHIYDKAFHGCGKLQHIHATAHDIEKTIVNDSAFDKEIFNQCVLMIPHGTRWAYKHHPVFGKFCRIETEE